MSQPSETEKTFTQAEFDHAIANWKAAMTPRLVQTAKSTAADILEKFAETIKNAEVEDAPANPEEAALAALATAAGMARDLAATLREQATSEIPDGAKSRL